MYDTVNLSLSIDDVAGVDFMEETPCYLSDCSEHIHPDGSVVVTGHLGRLNVTVMPRYVKVGRASLCKWYLGDNYQTMGRGDTQRAIEGLSDVLHLPMANASVTRLDVACNIITKHPVAVYFNHLGTLRYAKRMQQPSGLYYHRERQTACFYDKNKEQRNNGERVPELYRDRNVLRYELRLTKRLPEQLGVAEVNGALLYDEAFYIKLLKRWVQEYTDIDKINDIILNFGAMKGKRQFYRMGVLSMVERVGGEVEMIGQINEAQRQGTLSPKEAHDLRKAVKEACEDVGAMVVKNEAISELDRKILGAVKYYR